MEWWLALKTWLVAHPDWIVLLVFAMSALEAVAFIGIAVPGVAALFALTLIAGSAGIDFWLILASGVVGAMVGDGISFLLGKVFKHRIETVWPFRKHPQWLAGGEAFFERHGGKSIIIGRFIGPLRTFVPLAAGILNMPAWRFLWMNFLSAIAWAPFHILPGYGLGAAAEHPLMPGQAQMLLLGGLIAVIFAFGFGLPWLAGQLSERLALRLPAEASLHGWLRTTDLRPESQALAILLALAGLSLFLLLALNLAAWHAWDVQLAASLSALRHPLLDVAFAILTTLGNRAALLTFLAPILAWLAWRRQWAAVFHGLIVIALALTLPDWFKLLFAVPRPELVALPPRSFAFPSGHATSAILIWGYLAILLKRGLPPGHIAIPVTLALALILPTALSRLYLGMHWSSDVLGGLLLGGSLLALLRWSYYRHAQTTLSGIELSLVFTLALAAALFWQVLPAIPAVLAAAQPL